MIYPLLTGLFGGALLVLLSLAAWLAYLSRGHRIDWTGVRVVSTRSYLSQLNWKDAPDPVDLPIGVMPKQKDYWEQAHEGERERGSDE
jgi:hypothetical protein